MGRCILEAHLNDLQGRCHSPLAPSMRYHLPSWACTNTLSQQTSSCLVCIVQSDLSQSSQAYAHIQDIHTDVTSGKIHACLACNNCKQMDVQQWLDFDSKPPLRKITTLSWPIRRHVIDVVGMQGVMAPAFMASSYSICLPCKCTLCSPMV